MRRESFWFAGNFCMWGSPFTNGLLMIFAMKYFSSSKVSHVLFTKPKSQMHYIHTHIYIYIHVGIDIHKHCILFAKSTCRSYHKTSAQIILLRSMADRESDGETSEDLDSPGRHSAGSQHESATELEALELQHVIPKIAGSIAQMEVANPEVLRVTPAFSAFQNLAVALRVGCHGDFYYKSRKSERISTFWSHSWHGGQWKKKILTLLTFYNGPAAMFFAFVIATLMMILFASGYLPFLDRGFWTYKFSVWCLPSGFAVATMVMLLWRSQTKVFLDRICISQQDQNLKAQAILSLAGLLKNSDVMLILWDPT